MDSENTFIEGDVEAKEATTIGFLSDLAVFIFAKHMNDARPYPSEIFHIMKLWLQKTKLVLRQAVLIINRAKPNTINLFPVNTRSSRNRSPTFCK